MTTTALPTTGLDVIEALDFDPELACESPPKFCDHDQPATWYMRSHCKGILTICEPCAEWERKPLPAGWVAQCIHCSEFFQWTGSRILGPVRTP